MCICWLLLNMNHGSCLADPLLASLVPLLLCCRQQHYVKKKKKKKKTWHSTPPKGCQNGSMLHTLKVRFESFHDKNQTAARQEMTSKRPSMFSASMAGLQEDSTMTTDGVGRLWAHATPFRKIRETDPGVMDFYFETAGGAGFRICLFLTPKVRKPMAPRPPKKSPKGQCLTYFEGPDSCARSVQEVRPSV